MIFNIILVSVWLLFPLAAHAQSFRYIPSNQPNEPLLILITEGHLMTDMNQKVLASKRLGSTSICLIDGSQLSPESIADSLNSLLNRPNSIDEQHIHLVIAGSQTFFDLHNRFSGGIFASAHFFFTESNPQVPKTFKTIAFSLATIDRVLTPSEKEYTWMIDVRNNYTPKYLRDTRKNFTEFGAGLKVGYTGINAVNVSSYTPDGFFTYSGFAYRQLNKHQRLRGEFDLAFKIPNPQKEIQQQVQSQIDPSAILNGTGSDSIDISATFNGHFYFSPNLEVQHLFLPNRLVRPFVGVGLGYNLFTAFQAQIDTVIEFDASSLGGGGFGGGGGGGFGGFGGDSENADLSPTIFKYWSVPISAGVMFNLGDKITSDFTVKYNHSTTNLGWDGAAAINMVSFKLGFAYRFNGKKKLYYDYFRLEE